METVGSIRVGQCYSAQENSQHGYHLLPTPSRADGARKESEEAFALTLIEETRTNTTEASKGQTHGNRPAEFCAVAGSMTVVCARGVAAGNSPVGSKLLRSITCRERDSRA